MLRVGTVGTSSIMRTIQEAIRLTDGMECRVVYSRTEEQGRAFAAEMGVPEHCTDYAAMLERSDLDLIDIASPNRFHVEQALAALEHGKHVFSEKPLAAAQRRKLSGNSAVTSDKTAADNSEKARMPNACSALQGIMRQSTPESTLNSVT